MLTRRHFSRITTASLIANEFKRVFVLYRGARAGVLGEGGGNRAIDNSCWPLYLFRYIKPYNPLVNISVPFPVPETASVIKPLRLEQRQYRHERK